ncbi:transposase [Oxynema sp. CENA135]|uniref:transposase n=1 Tax=Oxynema sp. CENA135 TaxID=984206 RepID=UPI001F464BDB|nr:transposase [Oxynema sp. CENA135]
MPLQVREWTCPNCGTVRDRDINAAQPLLVVGDRVTVGGVREPPLRRKTPERSRRGQKLRI